jgi:hypothetical protein
MKHTYLILLFFALAGSVSAQISDALNRNPVENKVIPDQKTIRICAPSRAGIIANPPLYVVNNIVLSGPNVLEYIRPNSIEAMNVVTPEQGNHRYGAGAKNGVIEITLKKEIKFWNLEELLKTFKIKKKYWNLPVFIETKRLVTSNDFHIASDIIKNVEVIKTDDKPTKDRFIKVWLKPL